MKHPIWKINLFRLLPEGKVECLECGRVLQLSHGSIKSLKEHLKRMHKDSEFVEQYEKAMADLVKMKQSREGKTHKKQRKLDDFVAFDGHRQKRIKESDFAEEYEKGVSSSVKIKQSWEEANQKQWVQIEDFALRTTAVTKHPIWHINLFRPLPGNKAECVVCNKVLMLSNGSIKSLKEHLKRLHKDSDFAEQYEKGVSSSVKIKQSSGIISKLDKEIIDFIACNNLPFHVLNSTHFKKICRNREDLKDESYYRRILPTIYGMVRERIKEKISTCEKFTFTTDGWSGNDCGFISLAIEGISPNWKKMNFCLELFKFEGSHKGERVAERIRQFLNEWKIGDECVHCFVTDGGANLQKAFEILAFNQTECAAQLLNRAIIKSFGNKNGALSELFTKCKGIVARADPSIIACEDFHHLAQISEDLPQHKLLQEFAVRWKSTLIMCRRLFEQKEALDWIAYEKKDWNLTLQKEAWILLEQLIKLLNEVELASNMFCEESISTLIPFAYGLIRALQKHDLRVPLVCDGMELTSINELEQVRAMLIDELRDRLLQFESIKLYALSTYLDPRFKNMFFTDKEFCNFNTTGWLKEEQRQGYCSDLSSSYSAEPSSFLDFVSEVARSRPINVTHSDDIDDEIERYDKLDCITPTIDPIDWWSENEVNFPKLAKIARCYLSAPATSTESERMFNAGRDIFDYNRSGLSLENAKMLVFLHEAIPKVGYY